MSAGDFTPGAPSEAAGDAPVAWEYENQYGNKFLTHSDPNKWHPHDQAGFRNFRHLGYTRPTPAGAGELPALQRAWDDLPKQLQAHPGVKALHRAALSAGAQPAAQEPLSVWYGKMPESNGRNNWTAILRRGKGYDGVTIARSEYPHRVRYAADCVRHLIGEINAKPPILDYDGDECTPCHLCGGTGEVDGKPCWGLNFDGTVHGWKRAKVLRAAAGGKGVEP